MIDELKIYRLPEMDIIGDATAHFTEPHFPPGEIPLEESNRRRDQLFQHSSQYRHDGANAFLRQSLPGRDDRAGARTNSAELQRAGYSAPAQKRQP